MNNFNYEYNNKYFYSSYAIIILKDTHKKVEINYTIL